MKLVAYLKSLFPTFTKNKVLESCSLTQQSIKEYTLPAYLEAAELFKIAGIKAKPLNEFITSYSKDVSKVTDKTFISDISSILEDSLLLLELIEDAAKKDISTTEASLALTYKKATLLRLIQTAEFLSVYSRKLLNYVYIIETNAINPESTSLKDSLNKVEISFVEDNYYDFTRACGVIKAATKGFKKSYEEIPEAVISDLSEVTLPETIGLSKLDPFLMSGFIDASVVWNPFYAVGMLVANWQANNFKKTQNEFNLLQLRLFNLKNTHDKKPDAALEKEINYTQERINDLEYAIHNMKKEYNV